VVETTIIATYKQLQMMLEKHKDLILYREWNSKSLLCATNLARIRHAHYGGDDVKQQRKIELKCTKKSSKTI